MKIEFCGGCNWGFIGCSDNVDEMIAAHECKCAIEVELPELELIPA